MDIGKSFTYVFDDEKWITKLLIAAGILLGGILLGILVIPAIAAGLLLAGYGLEITRRVINGHPEVLPAWEDWGDLLVDGLKVAVVSIVYSLPMILGGLCLGIPAGIASEDAPELASLLSLALSCINFLWGIVVGIVLPAALAFLADKGEISAAFRFGEVLTFVKDNFKTYLIVLVIGWVASLISGLGLLVCGVGLLATAPYAGWITSHLAGQAYLEASGRTAQTIVQEEFI